MINTCTKFEFNPSTSWGSYARHRHNLLHGARSTTDIKPWHKHTTGELKKHINHFQTFILHYKTWAVVKDRNYMLVHAIECIIATLAKSVFKILAFTF